jgi:hypothetical protein
MKESNTQIDLGIPQGFRTGRRSLHLDRFDSASAAATSPLQAVEPLLDCAAAAAVLGGLYPKTVARWACEGRIPAYHYFRHWNVSDLESADAVQDQSFTQSLFSAEILARCTRAA